ncbi:MAG: EAL domain-containing protein [Erysipelotrichaceae bacterium]
MEHETETLQHYFKPVEFRAKVRKIISESKLNEDKYVLVSFDFDNFNFINDLFSYELGNKTLELMTINFSKELGENEIFTRIHADHFAFLLKAQEKNILLERFARVSDFKHIMNKILPIHYSLICSAGVVYIDEKDESIASYMDKANYARKQAKKCLVNQCLFYDHTMEETLEWRKTVTLMMEASFSKREFEMYLQPKIEIQSNKIVGSEALVRWNNCRFGLIYPERFIPIFEQNGFVKQLDFYMLEQACIFIEKANEYGIKPLPISVNFSKLHLRTKDFVEHIYRVVNQHHVSPSLIEIEFTENVYLEDIHELVEIISNLKHLGFKVALDDFGSAYSSLNYLKELPIDVIKMDKEFLNTTGNGERGRMIISKIIDLIKSLQMVCVMEGVETQEQIDFLSKTNCDIAQGFLYSEAISIKAFVEFVKNGSTIESVENNVPIEKEELNMDTIREENWELYSLGKHVDIGLIKAYIEKDEKIQYINDRALAYFGYSRKEFSDLFNNRIQSIIYPKDDDMFHNQLKHLAKKNEPLAFHCRTIRKDSKIITFMVRASCLIDSNGDVIGIFAFYED